MIQEVLAAIRDWANPKFKEISDTKLGDFAGSNAATEIADIKTAVGDVRALIGYAINEIDAL